MGFFLKVFCISKMNLIALLFVMTGFLRDEVKMC